MRTLLLLSALCLPLAAQDDDCAKCGNKKFGTSVQWVGSPSEAAKAARESEKLVFVLHVSGYFEDPKFT